MNDRYLFRGKRHGMSKVPYGDGWVIGHLIETPKVPSRSGWSIADYTANPSRITYDDIDPATIGQCIGLNDTNGNLIFEGDIVRRTNKSTEFSEVGVVRYAESHLKFCLWNKEFDCPMNFYGKSNVHGIKYSFEVIGNIHDDSKLLEVQND